MIVPVEGSIWRDVYPRFERHVRVQGPPSGFPQTVRIRTVVKRSDGVWVLAPRSRDTYANLDRFNGKRGGYEIVETAP